MEVAEQNGGDPERGVEDMINLSLLDEEVILKNIKARYERELIYTFTGSILVSVNPYKMFNIYGLDMVKKYEGRALGNLPPHLFAIGSTSYSKMMKDLENQVIVISGESGSGKTEATKLVMQYLAAVNKNGNNLITEQILEANPLLESFGNAKTIRNDNSSRFGKYIEVFFKSGSMVGARTSEYLLEKSRIVTQAPDERNYHVFYEILAGMTEDERKKYGLQTANKYFYLNQGGNCDISGRNDVENYRVLTGAFHVLNFEGNEKETIYKILASVLHFGNIFFKRVHDSSHDTVLLGNDAEIKWISHLLQLSEDWLKQALTSKVTETRGDRVVSPFNIDQALDSRDAIAKALYSRLFTYLVEKINLITSICNGSTTCQNGGTCTTPNYCTCIPGFASPNCEDIDECSLQNGGCDQNCANTHGSFECSCDRGYLLQNDNKTCIDKNECIFSNGGCSQICVNDYESHHCECSPGFKLEDDGQSCSDEDNCIGVNCLNGGSCIDNTGSYSCKCPAGFEDHHCGKDVNECLFVNGGCEDICVNDIGSYHCNCSGGTILAENGYACEGNGTNDENNGQTIFEIHKIARRLLPKGCAILEIASCDGSGSTKNLILSSTSSWYKLHSNSNIFFTFGVVFLESGDLALPVSVSGVEVISMNSNFELKYGLLKYKEHHGIPLANNRTTNCFYFETTPKDVRHLFNAFLPTLFDSMTSALPNWVQFTNNETGAFSVTDLKTDLFTGSEMDTLTECKGAPLIKNNKYSLFRFGTNMAISIFENEITIPDSISGQKFCLIIDICQDNGGTAFFIVPSESADFLQKFEFFELLNQEYGVKFRPVGIGLSLSKQINVQDRRTHVEVWNGDNLIQYPVFKFANVWLQSYVDYKLEEGIFSLDITGSTQILLSTPSLQTLLTGIFVDEWAGLIEFKDFSATPSLKFELFKQEIVIQLKDIVTASLDVYFSVGGQNERQWCGTTANPEGIFVSFMINANPFKDVPLLKSWGFNANARMHAFVSTDTENNSTVNNKINIFNDIVDLAALLARFRVKITDSILEAGQDMTDAVLVSLDELKVLLLSFNRMLTNVEQSGNMKYAVETIEKIWKTFKEDLKKKGQDILDQLEYNQSSFARKISQLIKNEQSLIGHNIDSIISKTRNQVFTLVSKHSGFGMKFSVDFTLMKLGFGQLDVEMVYSVDRLSQCSKFKKVYELLKGEPSVKFIGRITTRRKLGFFVTQEKGGYISLACSITGNKFIGQIGAHVAVLGMKASGEIIISENTMTIQFDGSVWDAFYARIVMVTPLGKDWYDLSFSVTGELLAKQGETDFGGSYMDGLRRMAKNIGEEANKRLNFAKDKLTDAQNSLSSAQDTISDAQNEVRKGNVAFDLAVKSMDNAKEKLEAAKGPFEKALEVLKKAQKNVDTICKIRACPGICVPGLYLATCGGGWFKYPCFKWSNCLFRIPDALCHLANIACNAVRVIAYVALEAAKIFVRIPMLALDAAKALVSVAQFVVDKSRVTLLLAEGVLELAKVGLEVVKGALEVAKIGLETIKFILGAALHVFDLIIRYGVQSLIDVKKCRFDLELSTSDKAIFDVSCQIKAFNLNWHTFRFEYDFRHPLVSMFRIAKSTVATLLEMVGDILGKRKKRDISFQTMANIHHILQLHKRDTKNKSDNPQFEAEYTNSTSHVFTDDLNLHSNSKSQNRIEYFRVSCTSFTRFHAFLLEATDTLVSLTNESTSVLDDIHQIKISLENSEILDISKQNVTLESLGINPEYALREFNITQEELQESVNNTLNNTTDDPYMTEITESSQFAADVLSRQMTDAESISVIKHWTFGMQNYSQENFEELECIGLEDCMLFSLSQLYDIFADVSVQGVEESREIISSLEEQILDIIQNTTRSVQDSYRLSSQIVENLYKLNESNIYCSRAPEITDQIKDQRVFTGSSVYMVCNVTGNPNPLIRWYHNDVFLPEHNKEKITLYNVSAEHEGLYKCEAENVVTSVLSKPAAVFVIECHSGTFYNETTNECLPCEYGYYQPHHNRRNCLQCNTGYFTLERESQWQSDCKDIDECQTTQSLCEHKCINTNGTYVCSCSSGFSLNSDGKTCTDSNGVLAVKVVAGVVTGLAIIIAVLIVVIKFKLYLKFRTSRSKKQILTDNQLSEHNQMYEVSTGAKNGKQ
ncbi:Hypothetical predicted protein [Mytilus galloprovincialis]|uniref:Uncharacterized protein n=1 Tax=Mytilus galloprovincialis TaxID=29158 RepID=A0A8B6GB50_MYTGA|nr:Hypothetical predicted protein [Mytilus galloprovincialis]